MVQFRIVDAIGNRHDVESDFLPRIGERIEELVGINKQPVRQRFSRVKDVSHRIDGDKVLVEVRVVEEPDAEDWPR